MSAASDALARGLALNNAQLGRTITYRPLGGSLVSVPATVTDVQGQEIAMDGGIMFEYEAVAVVLKTQLATVVTDAKVVDRGRNLKVIYVKDGLVSWTIYLGHQSK